MDIRPPDATHGPTQFWFCDTQDEAEKLATALRAKYGEKEVVPPPSYSIRLGKYVVTCVDAAAL